MRVLTRCLVEEMKAVASAGNANCCVIEESTCSTANGNGHSNGSNTVQPENILWKRFDQRVEDSTQCRTDTVGALVEKQQYLQHSNIDRHLFGGSRIALTCQCCRNLQRNTFAYLPHLFQQNGYFLRLVK